MNEKKPRTPEDIIASTLASASNPADENHGQWHEAADMIMRDLKLAGFTVEDELSSRNGIMSAVNAGASLVQDDPDLYLSGRDTDLINLIVNAIGAVLDNPDITLDEAIQLNYGSTATSPECAACESYVKPDPDSGDPDSWKHADHENNDDPEADADHRAVLRDVTAIVKGWIDRA